MLKSVRRGAGAWPVQNSVLPVRTEGCVTSRTEPVCVSRDTLEHTVRLSVQLDGLGWVATSNALVKTADAAIPPQACVDVRLAGLDPAVRKLVSRASGERTVLMRVTVRAVLPAVMQLLDSATARLATLGPTVS